MRKPPKGLQPLLEMTGSSATTVADLRAALEKEDGERLKKNGYHVLMALANLDDLADVAIKFACVHEALASDPSVNAQVLSARWNHRGQWSVLNDEQACRVISFLLDENLLRPFPGLVYQACRMGLRECAKMIFARGIYAPLEWEGYAGDKPEDHERMVRLLIEVARPTEHDLKIIRKGLKGGGVAAALVDAEIERIGSTEH